MWYRFLKWLNFSVILRLSTWFKSDVKPKLIEWFDWLLEMMEVFVFWFKIGLLFIAFVIGVFVFAKFSWGWIVPKIFPNMVGKGWLPESLTCIQILKLFLFFGFLNLSSFTKNLNLVWKEYFESTVMKLVVDWLISVIFLIITGFLVFISWNWVIADVFSNAVVYNLVPSNLSFWNSILLVFLCRILGLTGRSAINIFENEK